MQAEVDKREMAKRLQAKINAMQGLGKSSGGMEKSDLAPFTSAFPNRVFPMGAIHEFISYEPADAASTSGFITALTSKFIKEGGICLWVGSEMKIFPSGLKHFGLEPDRIVFINTPNQKDRLWIVEEALKCEALTAVIGDIKELGFTESRRLQLAVERSGVVGFIHRYRPHSENAVACTTRWKIKPLATLADDGLPGVGHSCWDVQLLKVRNGRPSAWQIRWSGQRFMPMTESRISIPTLERFAG